MIKWYFSSVSKLKQTNKKIQTKNPNQPAKQQKKPHVTPDWEERKERMDKV